MSKSSPPPSFKQAMTRLEEIIEKADSPAVELEEIIALMEEGKKLLKYCDSTLQQAELRIQQLSNSDLTDGTSTPAQEETDDSFSLS